MNKEDNIYTVETAEQEKVTWQGMEMRLSTVLQYQVSINGEQRYTFDLEDDGVDSNGEAIALAKRLEEDMN